MSEPKKMPGKCGMCGNDYAWCTCLERLAAKDAEIARLTAERDAQSAGWQMCAEAANEQLEQLAKAEKERDILRAAWGEWIPPSIREAIRAGDVEKVRERSKQREQFVADLQDRLKAALADVETLRVKLEEASGDRAALSACREGASAVIRRVVNECQPQTQGQRWHGPDACNGNHPENCLGCAVEELLSSLTPATGDGAKTLPFMPGCDAVRSLAAAPASERREETECPEGCHGIEVGVRGRNSGCSCRSGLLADGRPQPPGFKCDCPGHPQPTPPPEVKEPKR